MKVRPIWQKERKDRSLNLGRPFPWMVMDALSSYCRLTHFVVDVAAAGLLAAAIAIVVVQDAELHACA